MPLGLTALHAAGVVLVALLIALQRINSSKPGGVLKVVASHGPKLFLTFVIGLCLGIVLPSLAFTNAKNPGNTPAVESNEQQELYETLSGWLQMNSTFAVDLLTGVGKSIHYLYYLFKAKNTETREVEARRLAEKVRILCLVVDDPKQIQRKNGSKNTWGRHCNKLIFTSEVEDRKERVVEDSASAWKSVVRALNFVGKKYLNDFEWFVRLDDETFLLVENLRRALDPHSVDDPKFYGFHFNTLDKPNATKGFVLSRQAVRRLVEEGFQSNSIKCRNENQTGVDDDLEIASCLNHLEMKSVDVDGETLSFDDSEYLLPVVSRKNWWKQEFEFWPYGKPPSPPKKRTSCCRRNLISFHHVWPQKMYLLEYLIYDVQVFGAPIKRPHLEYDSKLFKILNT